MPGLALAYHMRIRDVQSYEFVRKGLLQAKNILWLRDGKKVQRIQQAQSVEELIDFAPSASGLGEITWFERMRHYGPEVIAWIAEALRQAAQIPLEKERKVTFNILISELRWRGTAGADALVENFDALDDYGKCLACVALGLSGAHAAADMIWDYSLAARAARQWDALTGALLGLIDLQDARAGEALADLLSEGFEFYELYGFLARAGDRRAFVPLASRISALQQDHKMKDELKDAMVAMLAIAHRTGRQAVIDEFKHFSGDDDAQHEESVDQILQIPENYVAIHFAEFFRGFELGDFEKAIDQITDR